MTALEKLSAREFITRMENNNLPSRPYIVDEEVRLYGSNESPEKEYVIRSPVSLKGATFTKRIAICDVKFACEFDFKDASFRENVNISCEFEDVVNFTAAKFCNDIYLNSFFYDYVSLGWAFFRYLSFNRSRASGKFDFEGATALDVNFSKAAFDSGLYLGAARFRNIDFEDVTFSELNVGANPAIGWLYTNSLQGVSYSLEDACEMCGHSRPLEGWVRVKREIMGREYMHWKFVETSSH